jgi:hypothetical protein
LTVLAIIGILLAVIIAIIVVLLLSSIRVFFSFNTKNKPELKAKFLFFTVFDINKPKKKSKKPSRIGSAIKRMLGFEQIIESQTDEGEKQKESISSKVTGFVTVFMLLTDSNLWLTKKIKAKQLKLDIICGGSDAADAAIEYGVVCSAVYPFIGYLETNFKGAEKALDVNIGCDFENEAYFGTDIKIKLRIIHIVRALMRSASEQMEAMNEQ